MDLSRIHQVVDARVRMYVCVCVCLCAPTTRYILSLLEWKDRLDHRTKSGQNSTLHLLYYPDNRPKRYNSPWSLVMMEYIGKLAFRTTSGLPTRHRRMFPCHHSTSTQQRLSISER